MERIKVLEVIRQGQIGGGESHLLDLVWFLDRQKFEPVCLSFTDGEMVTRLRQMGITCHIIDSQKPFDLQVQRQVGSLLSEEHVQIVHAHGSRAASNILYPTLRAHLPLIYTVHGWSFHDDQSRVVKTLRAWSEKLICHYATQVICVSQSNKDTGREVFGLRSAIVVENGVNLDRFDPSRQFKGLRKGFGFCASDFVVGFVARCTKQKNPLGFLEALRMAHEQAPDVKGLFIGEGDMDAEVDAYIGAHGMEGYLYRSPFRTDIPDVLDSMDVYCLPSLWEGLSIALLEAMAMQKAIVATPTDGTKELIVDGNNGLLVPFNDVSACADAILRLYGDRYLMASCSMAARQFVSERFNAKRVAESVEDVYLKML